MRFAGFRLTFLLALAACNTSESPPASAPAPVASPSASAPPSAPSAAPEGTVDSGAALDAAPRASTAPIVITLERTACLGTCPVYTVALRDDGSFVFAGWYPKKGCAFGSIAPAELASLLTNARSIGWLSLKASYTRPVTDLPSVDTQVTLDGKTKKVHHYGYGTAPIERSLTAFENAIDAAVDAKRLLTSPLGTCGGQSPYPGVP